ncbi:MAG: LON peptidase substrate-binding domain-containing protein [Acidobacteriota bacterium]
MAAPFVLPLYPLEERVLLPGESISFAPAQVWSRALLAKAQRFGNAVVASLVDGESVHEIAVTARLSVGEGGEATLRGLARCRLLSLVSEKTLLVRAHRYPDSTPEAARAEQLATLLRARYSRLQRSLGRTGVPASRQALSALTWRITADIGFTAEQQQGFLNVVDPLTRGRLLLVAVRELERREKFLRPFAALRSTTPWN